MIDRLRIMAILLLPMAAFGQERLTLEACYRLVESNYPLVNQRAMFEKQNALNLELLNIEKLPDFNISAQTTYQSAVIQVPLPGIEAINKDQYRATVNVNQLIYDGDAIDAALDVQTADLATKQKQLEVNLYQLKAQVNQLYFSILLQQEKWNLLTSKKELLEAKLQEVKAEISYGTMLPASDKVIEAELLKIRQLFNETDLNKTNLFLTLSALIGKDINESVTLENSDITTNLQSQISRPELDLFRLKKTKLDASDTHLSKQNSPKVFGFLTGGYGNPGLNMLDNSFQPFYTLGVKMSYNIFDWKSNDKKRKSLAVNKEILDNQTEVFELSTTIELNRLQAEIEKLTSFITSDLEIIELRKRVLKSAESQLKNGVITSSAYLAELTQLFEDQNMMNMHRIQLSLVKANYNTTKGQ